MVKRLYLYMVVLTVSIVFITAIVLGVLFFGFYTDTLIHDNVSLISVLIMMIPALVGLTIPIFVFLYYFSSKLTDIILQPLKNAAKNIESILSGEEVVHEPAYAEINPLIRTIRLQKIEIENNIKKLKDTERYRRDFTANVSHELKTPLTSIIGYAELIESGNTSVEDTKKFSNIIHKEGSKLLGLIDSIINLSKLEYSADSKTSEELEILDLNQLSNEIVNKIKRSALQKNIKVSIYGEEAEIRGDRRMIEDLLNNLIDNSIKYNRINGKVDIYIKRLDKEVMLQVVDTGIGIPEEDQSRVFERFYRVDKSRSKRITGTGIGLSIVKHIVEYHGGKIKLTSETNKGTDITITFPVSKSG